MYVIIISLMWFRQIIDILFHYFIVVIDTLNITTWKRLWFLFAIEIYFANLIKLGFAKIFTYAKPLFEILILNSHHIATYRAISLGEKFTRHKFSPFGRNICRSRSYRISEGQIHGLQIFWNLPLSYKISLFRKLFLLSHSGALFLLHA